MIVLDLTAIRVQMLRCYAQLKHEASGNRQTLIHLLAGAAQDHIAVPSVFPSPSSPTLSPSPSPGSGKTRHAVHAADTLAYSASSALAAVLLVVAEELVDKLEAIDLPAATAVQGSERAHGFAGDPDLRRESVRGVASDAALGCFAALCERGWTPAQIHATVDRVADRALALLHQRAAGMSRRWDAAFVTHFTAALDELALAAGAIDSVRE